MKKGTVLLLMALTLGALACTSPEKRYVELHRSFVTPGDEARPQVWWHWMNGNVTWDGVRKDIEWMKRAGIGGFHLFDAAMETPQIVDHRVDYMSDEFREILSFALNLADSLGLETAIASSPGFSESGGPWVPGEDGMKRLSWREMDVTGGADGPTRIVLPAPYDGPSIFQNHPSQEIHWGVRDHKTASALYRDIAVLAFPISSDEVFARKPVGISCSGGDVTAEALFDDDLQSVAYLAAAKPGQKRWIEIDYGSPRTIRAIQYCIDKFRSESNPAQTLWASDDGLSWRKVADLTPWMFVSHTISFEAVTARRFRFEAANSTDGTPLAIRTLRLFGTPMTMRFEDVLGFWPNHVGEKTPGFDCGIDGSAIVNLTDKLLPDGTLEWEIPEGEWRIMRFGWALTGKVNHPASPEATGLEVDKMDAAAVERYYRNYLDIYNGMKVDAMLNDSYEAHGSTWSESLPHEFAGRCGYDLTGWLPAVAGYIINDSAATDAFIYDWVHTNGRLIVENHYDKLTEILHPLGMKRISESHEGRRAFHCDGMEVKRSADIPMSAMWVNSTHNPHYLGEADLRESASVAHIYGQKFVAAESFTAGSDLAYSFVPADLKPTADDELAAGINRFIIHESAHQPSDSHIPGLGLGNYGQWFNRHEMWAELARPWTDYLARSSHLLMQGLNVADIAYLYGERYNATYFAREGHPAVPRGYAYDYINAETLLKYSKVKKGRLVMPSGVSYRLLALDESTDEMSPALLARLGELAAAGVEICGSKPTVMAGLGGDKTAFHNLAEEIWKMDCINIGTIGEALQSIGLKPDVEWNDDVPLRFVHRELDFGEIYWISNPTEDKIETDISLRCCGYMPMLWRAEDGSELALDSCEKDGRTSFRLTMEPHDAVFVVLVRKAEGCEDAAGYAMAEKAVHKTSKQVDGPWKVLFHSPVYESFERVFSMLADFSQVEDDDDVRYFSGCAAYSKTIDCDGFRTLDLGKVYGIAELMVNGESRGVQWHAPYRFNLNGLPAGENNIEIRITTPWRNRLIGDRQPGRDGVRTFCSNTAITAESPLVPSGLLGPVVLY